MINISVEKIKRFYEANTKRFTIGGALFGGLIVLSVISQFVYPAGRTLPGQKIGGYRKSYNDAPHIKAYLADNQKDMQLSIRVGDNQKTVSWQDLGITIDQDVVSHDALSYSWKQKLIPFSALYRIAFHDQAIATHTDNAKLFTYAQTIATDNYKDPANASLSIDGTKVVRNAQKPGVAYDPVQIVQKITSTPYKKDATIALIGKPVQSSIDQAHIEAAAKKAEVIIATETKVNAAGTIQTVTSTEVSGWLTFNETADKKDIVVDINKDKVKAYLNSINKAVYKAPGQMTVTVQDGKEVARTADTSGQSIDIDASANTIAASVLSVKPETVTLPIARVAPKITYNRSYTKSQAGLNALLGDLSANETDMAISLRALDGSGVVASAKGAKQYAPASTYKLSVIYSVIKRVEAGSMQLTDNVDGRNVDQCISAMIIVSDNPCGTALGNKVGWQNVTNEARAIGMSGTNYSNGFVSTANDQAVFLTKLYQGSLMNDANTAKIIGLMKQQKYRTGIPAGVNGAVVADKVGFIDSLIHDSAIVYAPKGPYVLVIYSNKSSWAHLAAVTTQINNLMSQ